MHLSIVTTLYRSASFINEFHERMAAAAARITSNFEIVFVNDGSPDDSLDLAVRLSQRDERVTVVDLSRNFGHHHAIMAGLSHARGEYVFLIDVDLEEQPEWLERFWNVFNAEGADVVYGLRETRAGSGFKKYSGSLFYKLFNAISETPIPENACTVRLMSRGYCNALLELREASLFLAGLFEWTGFRQVPVPVVKQVQSHQSNYHLLRMLSLFVNAITSFSSYPLKLVFALGAALTSVSFLIGAYLIVRKLSNPTGVALGYSSIMVSVWFLGGLIISFLGIIGLYLSGIFHETKRRPQYIVRRTYGGRSSATPLLVSSAVPQSKDRV